ncbi:MAG: hypothetical protein ACRD12_03540 [Acidimicrobiales bacterium]
MLWAVSMEAVAVVVLSRSRRRWLRAFAAALLAVSTTAPQLRVARLRYERQIAHPVRRQIRASLAAEFDAIVHCYREFDVSDIAVQVFVVRRASLARAEELQRLERVCLAELPLRGGTGWAPGYGVIGRCWQEDRILVCDLRDLYQLYATEAEWAAAPPSVRMGLSWDEARALLDRYTGTIAVPFHDADGQVAGVVSMDCLKGADFQRFLKDELALRETIVSLASASRVIARVLSDWDRGEALWS